MKESIMNQSYIRHNPLLHVLFLFLVALLITVLSPAKARTNDDFNPAILPSFPVRNVLIITPILNQRNYNFNRYMTAQLQNVFKYPYYESTVTSSASINLDTISNTTTECTENNSLKTRTHVTDLTNKATLAQIAEQYHVNIVIVPFALDSTYYQYHPIRFNSIFDDNDELYTVASIRGSIYYYDKDTNDFGKVEANYFEREEYLSVPSEQEIWYTVMTRLLNKLPYKRVPTDINRYETSTNIITFNQVEQPKNTKFSLTGISEL